MYFNKLLLLFIVFFAINGCIPSNTYEKNESLLFHKWAKKEPKSFKIEIKDTTSLYLLFVTMRHTDAYHFSNLWVDAEITPPKGDSIRKKIEWPLAEKTGRWTGKGMNEIYEHKLRLPGNHFVNGTSYTKFNQIGIYDITLHQIMRENPLEEIMSIGVRLERVPSSQ